MVSKCNGQPAFSPCSPATFGGQATRARILIAPQTQTSATTHEITFICLTRLQFSSQDAEGPPAGRPAGLQLCVLLGTAQGTTPALLDTQCGAAASRWCRPCSRHATQSGRCPGLPLQVYRRQPIRTIHPEPSQAQIRTSNLGDLTAFSSASSHAVPSDWSIPTPCCAVGLSIRSKPTHTTYGYYGWYTPILP
ncbi:hypothetical protein CKAH01_00865 [Colletotrichum kahawae]|uniref:Uncharacterized protein n=1 Tax=Colletotrichum kahawae TaxID=34407 RepID=A0AAD9YHS1_COLKA|nr:hypothetical protein CKAH01_00865 [Colletotrichum kahawae]